MKKKLTILFCSLFIAMISADAFSQANSDKNIILLSDPSHGNDVAQYAWLQANGFNIIRWNAGSEIDLTNLSQTEKDSLNACDLVIAGRDLFTDSFNGPGQELLDNLEVPLIYCNAFGAFWSQPPLWFTNAAMLRVFDDSIYIKVSADSIFRYANPSGDSVNFCTGELGTVVTADPHNGTVLATANNGIAIIRFAANVPYNPDPGSITPVNERTVLSFQTGYKSFALTKWGQAVYYAEIRRMLGMSVEEPKEYFTTLVHIASLSELLTSAGKLSPPFDPDIINYSILLPSDINSLELTATPKNENAVVTGDGIISPLPAKASIEVSSEDGTSSLIYNVSILYEKDTLIFPPDKALVFDEVPKNIPKPGYLVNSVDPSFGSLVTRVTDNIVFGSSNNYHSYAKNQPWNSDGSLIKMEGWPSAILDGRTFELIKKITPSSGHHIWSNTDPEVIYGTSGNRLESQNVHTGVKTEVRTFPEYTSISLGDWEGNMSNDDRFAALRCSKPDTNFVLVYDLEMDSIWGIKNIGSIFPNNVAMSQSGKYAIIQWDIYGPGEKAGMTIHDRSLNFLRQAGECGGCHYDLGYDTNGNEVIILTNNDNASRAIVSVRLDNGERMTLLEDSQMSWYIHISCRNLDRPGWVYLTEFADANTQKEKPNWQKIFAIRIDGSGVTETFAHVHHSDQVNYNRSPFGVPNRDGSMVMFRSDWDDKTGEINSYVATMPYDSIPPSQPSELAASDIQIDNFLLSWSKSTDNILFDHYKIYIDGEPYSKTTSTEVLRVSNLEESQTYSFVVKAVDFSGNISDPSEPLTVTMATTGIDLQESISNGFSVNLLTEPASKQLKVEIISDRTDSFTAELVDIQGRVLQQGRLQNVNQGTIQFSNLESQTLYIIRMSNSSQNKVIRKLYIQ